MIIFVKLNKKKKEKKIKKILFCGKLFSHLNCLTDQVPIVLIA